MARSVATAVTSTPFNALAPKPAKASIAVNRHETSDDSGDSGVPVSLVFQTLTEIGMSDKEAAYTMAMDPAQLSRIKSGQQRMPIDALWRLPDLFWGKFTPKISEAKGLTERHLVKVRAARIAELVALLVEGDL